MKAYEVLESPEKWTTGTCFRNAEGEAVPYSQDAACCCVYGALALAYGGTSTSKFRRAVLEIEVVVGSAVGTWNDAPGRTHAEVVALLKKLNL